MPNHGIGAKKWPIANLCVFFLQRIIPLLGMFFILCRIISIVLTIISIILNICSDDMIDVEGSPPVKHHTILDTEFTDKNYVESVQKLSLLSTDENSADWEETVKRDGWTPLQNRIFNKVYALKMFSVFSQTNLIRNRL